MIKDPTTKRSHGFRRQWKSEEFDDLKPTTYDWCRMAAFIDGEGCLDVNTMAKRVQAGGTSYTVRIVLGNTNPRLAVWLKRTFGGSVKIRQNSEYNKNWKDSYIWVAMSTRAAWIMHNCLPWLLLKDAQASLLMSLQENIDLTRQGRGRSVDPESIAWRRQLKDELRLLNAKGPVNQIVMTKDDFEFSR